MDKWNSRIPFPTDNFIIRCIEEIFGASSNDNPMITLTFEVVSPEVVNIAGVDVSMAGTKITHRCVTKSEDPAKQDGMTKRVNEFFEKFGLPIPTDLENPTLGFKGKKVWALLNCDVQEKRRSPTAEQLAKGQKQGDILKNPIDGKPLINYWPRVEDVFGLAPE